MNRKTIKDLQKRTLTELGSAWDRQRFLQPRLPVIFDTLTNKTAFDTPATINGQMTKIPPPAGVLVRHSAQDENFITESGMYIENLPIKFPGSDCRIPGLVWDHFGDMLAQVIEIEKQVNPVLEEQYIYLTIQQGPVDPGNTHRPAGTHVDGFQKDAIIPQTIQHQISVTNTLPTIFYAAALPQDALALPKRDFFKAMAQTCADKPSLSPPPYTLHLLNAYCPHRPAPASEKTFRTFVRFSISTIPFMDEDNTRNKLFDYEWTPAKKEAYYRSIAKPAP